MQLLCSFVRSWKTASVGWGFSSHVRDFVPMFCSATQDMRKGESRPKYNVGNVCQWVHSESVLTDGVRVCVRLILAMSAHTLTIPCSPAWHPGRSAGNYIGCLNVCVCLRLHMCVPEEWEFLQTEVKEVRDREGTSTEIILALCQSILSICVCCMSARMKSMCARVYVTTATYVRPTVGETSCRAS